MTQVLVRNQVLKSEADLIAMTARNEVIIAILQNNPNVSLSQVAKAFSLSRERVRHIVHGVPGAMRPRHRLGKKQVYICPLCHGAKVNPYAQLCKKCLTTIQRLQNGGKLFICEECGVVFARSLSQINNQARHGQRTRWCSKKCHGAWLGKQRKRHDG